MRAFALAAAAVVGLAGAAEAKVVQINGFVASNTETGDKFVFLKDTWAFWSGDKIFAKANINPFFAAWEEEWGPEENEIGFRYTESDSQLGVDFWVESYRRQDTIGAGDKFYFPYGGMIGGAISENFPMTYTGHFSLFAGGTEQYFEFNRIELAAVPLPAAAPMLLTGAAALFGLRRIRAKR